MRSRTYRQAEYESGDEVSIFMQLHTDRAGISKPIVAMTDDHLYATLRWWLVKSVNNKVQEFLKEVEIEKQNIVGKFAPPEMSERQRITTGKRSMRDSDRQKLAEIDQKVQEQIEEVKTIALRISLRKMQPYLVVAMGRESLYQAVHQLIVEITGINIAMEMPDDVIYPVVDDEEEEIPELEAGEEESWENWQTLENQGSNKMDSNNFGDIGRVGNPTDEDDFPF
jgi:hypothetical protein